MPELLPGLTGYVLAGGQSSRMGQDKTAMRLRGSTLLETAVRKLRPVCAEVVVVGSVPSSGADRVIADRHPGCGPIGGIEAALSDLRAPWAMFLPVDMPLLPAGLVAALVRAWSCGVAGGAYGAFAVADGVAQPLVSLLHRQALATVETALLEGQYKVRPVLEQAAAALAAALGSRAAGALCRSDIAIAGTEAGSTPPEVRVGDDTMWQPTAAEWSFRHLWFSNLNTAAQFAEAEQAIG